MLKNYSDYDALGLAELVRDGKTTPGELLDSALAATEQVNAKIHALSHLDEKAARDIIDAGLPSGPFTGVPFLLKDITANAVGFPMTMGSRFFANTKSTFDTELVKRFRKSGLVIMGRTRIPEMAATCTSEAMAYDGFPVANPWNAGRSAGGSSGGAAAAVASGIVPIAHGSDGGGSLRHPASACGVFTLKPSRARLPAGPMVGESWGGLVSEGVLTRTVRDSAAALDAVHGPDPGAPYYAPPFSGSYSDAIRQKPRKLKMAFVKTTLDGQAIHPDVAQSIEATAELCRSLGHELVEDMPKDFDSHEMLTYYVKIITCGTGMAIEAQIRNLGREPGVDELEPSIRGAWELSRKLSGSDYLEALQNMHRLSREIAPFFEKYDMLLMPVFTEPPAVLGRFAMTNPDFWDYRLGENGTASYSPYTTMANMTGQPSISVPLFFSKNNLPLGSQFVGRAGEDDVLLQLAAQLERIHPWFDDHPPIFATL
jgi:amidase/6-aminohexanoate-cyclic-dimer hydrolase